MLTKLHQSFFLLLLLVNLSVYGQNIIVSASTYNIKNYNNWLNKKDCFEIDNFNHELATRATIQMLLICKALHYGGSKQKITFFELPNYSRSLRETQKGSITIPSDSVWLNTANEDDVFISIPLFKQGMFQKGFYALPDKREEIENQIKSNTGTSNKDAILEALKSYSIITSSGWLLDWHILSQLDLPIINTAKTENMCKMIKKGRGDLFLGELVMNGKTGLPFDCHGVILQPIRGIKVKFSQSRHFIVSKKHPESESIFKALQNGMKLLHETGELDRAMFPNVINKTSIEHWLDLAPQQVSTK